MSNYLGSDRDMIFLHLTQIEPVHMDDASSLSERDEGMSDARDATDRKGPNESVRDAELDDPNST